MKKHTYYSWAAALVAASLTLSSCGGDKEEDPPKDEGKQPAGENTKPEPKPEPEPAPEPAPEPEPEPEPTPEPTAAGGSVKKQIQGAWGMTKEGAIKMMKASMPAEAAADPNATAMIDGMAEMMYDKTLIELGDGTATITSPDGEEKETFEWVSTDDATGAFTVKMTSEDGTVEEGSGTVNGDAMTMKTEEMTMELVRLSAEEVAKRKEAIKNFDPSSLLPPGLIEGIEEGIEEGLEGLTDPAPVDPAPVDPAPVPVPGVE